jgi:hypothetical protein
MVKLLKRRIREDQREQVARPSTIPPAASSRRNSCKASRLRSIFNAGVLPERSSSVPFQLRKPRSSIGCTGLRHAFVAKRSTRGSAVPSRQAGGKS